MRLYEFAKLISLSLLIGLYMQPTRAGIGMMDDGITRKDYRGAPIPEPIYLLNNTISGCQYGITGGATLLVLYNIVQNCTNSELVFTGTINEIDTKHYPACIYLLIQRCRQYHNN
jgi:hypothetical protein